MAKNGLACMRRYGIVAGSNLFAQLELGSSANSLLKVQLPGSKIPIWVRRGTTDLDVLYQVFFRDEYDLSEAEQWRRLQERYQGMLGRSETPLIIDCGANIGLSAVWFASRFPEAEIIAVEPESANIEMMRKNLEPYANVRIVHGGIWDTKHRLSIVNSEAEPWAFVVQEDQSATVSGYTIDELVGDRSIFIAKIDIEGSEQALFRSNHQWMDKTDMLVIELHDWLFPGAGTSRNFFRRMADKKFDFLMKGENMFFFMHH